MTPRPKLALAAIALATLTSATAPQTDPQGRIVLYGPQSGHRYDRVHVISDTVGIENYSGLEVTNSVIEARVCIEVGPSNNYISGNYLACGGCIKFPSGALSYNTITNNDCTGALTNRPDIFG